MPGGEGLPYKTPQGLVYTSRTLCEPCLIVIDEKTGHITGRFLPYPEIYSDFYGELLMRTPYSTYNDDKSLIVVSFPADDNIHVLNLDTKVTYVYHAGSKYRNKKQKPLGKGRLGGLTVSPEKEIEYFREITATYSMTDGTMFTTASWRKAPRCPVSTCPTRLKNWLS